MVFSSCFGVVVGGPAVCVEDSLLTTFESNVTLLSTSEACRAVSIVRRVWQVVVKTVMTGGPGQMSLVVCVCGCICPIVVSPWFIVTCYTSCVGRELI